MPHLEKERQQIGGNGLCGQTLDDSCCRCMALKTCQDNGCEARFGGKGKYQTDRATLENCLVQQVISTFSDFFWKMAANQQILTSLSV